MRMHSEPLSPSPTKTPPFAFRRLSHQARGFAIKSFPSRPEAPVPVRANCQVDAEIGIPTAAVIGPGETPICAGEIGEQAHRC